MSHTPFSEKVFLCMAEQNQLLKFPTRPADNRKKKERNKRGGAQVWNPTDTRWHGCNWLASKTESVTVVLIQNLTLKPTLTSFQRWNSNTLVHSDTQNKPTLLLRNASGSAEFTSSARTNHKLKSSNFSMQENHHCHCFLKTKSHYQEMMKIN